jgi:hypothetical protein
MPSAKPKLLSHADGSVDVFYRGWRFRFPAGAEPPTVTTEEPPTKARPAGSKVKVGGLRMRYGRWVAVFDPTGKRQPRMIRARPPSLPGVLHRLYLKMRPS